MEKEKLRIRSKEIFTRCILISTFIFNFIIEIISQFSGEKDFTK